MQVQLPYLAEENHDEDPEVQVKPETDTAAARTAKDAIYNNKAKVSLPKAYAVSPTRLTACLLAACFSASLTTEYPCKSSCLAYTHYVPPWPAEVGRIKPAYRDRGVH